MSRGSLNRPWSSPETERALYRLLRVPGLGAAALARVLAAWREEPLLLDQFWHLPEAEHRRRWRLPAAAISFIHSEGRGEEACEAAEQDARRDRHEEIELLTVLHPWYADLAAARALPPVLFTRGNQDLLGCPGVAIVHSRDAGPAALDWGARLAAALAAAGVLLVSSQNRDGYRRAAAAAKRGGAPLVIVLDRPLHAIPADGPLAEPVVTARLWDPEFRPEQELLVSAARQGAAWRPRHARERDALVISLAAVTIAGDVRPAGNIAALAAEAAGAVLLSPFCRALLPGERLPEVADAAAERVLEHVRRLMESEGTCPSPPVLPGAGWLARKREQELTRFEQTLHASLGGRYQVERVTGTDLQTHLRDHGREIAAVVHLPGALPGGTDGAILIRSAEVVATEPTEISALVLTPAGPLSSLRELRQYLTACHLRVGDALIRNPRLTA